MPRQHPSDMPWVIVELKGQAFGLPSRDLRELVVVDQITPIAHTGRHIRGVVNLRGKVIPVVDLRMRLGLPSTHAETDGFCALMAQREQDHRHWVGELEASVRENRPFKLTTDPHQCAFGRWYDSYRAENVWVGGVLRKFDEPHQRIHQLGVEVAALVASGRPEVALERIQRAHTTDLQALLALFAELKTQVRAATRETLAVLSVDGEIAAATVDAALAVERLTDLAPLPGAAGAHDDSVVFRAGRRAGHPTPVMVIECEHLLSSPRGV